MNRRGYVIPEDVRSVALDVLRHRLGLTYEAEAEEINSDQIIQEIINKEVEVFLFCREYPKVKSKTKRIKNVDLGLLIIRFL